MRPGRPGNAAVRAWDLPVRVFHWALALLVLSAWLSYTFAEAIGDVMLKWHRANGLAILTFATWRVLWGVFGSSTALFASFVRWPRATAAYARDLAAGVPRRYLGHNPLGGWIIIVMLAALITQAGFGLFAVDDNDLTGGPLNHLVSEAANKFATRQHAFIFEWVLLPLIAVHVLANILYQLIKREPLVTAMITGHKPALPYEDASEAAIPKHVARRAALLLLLAASIVLGGVWAAGGKF